MVALRLPAALVTLLLVIFIYNFSLKINPNKTYALISSLILTTSFYVVFAGRNGQWDIFTHAFMIACIFQLYLLFTREDKKYQYAFLAALFFGLSFLSKESVSFYAFLIPFLIAFGIVYKFKAVRSKLIPLVLFLLVGFVLSSWWYWYTYTYDPQAFIEITQKETENWGSYNIRPFYYYWSFFTQSGVWTIPAFIGLLYPYLKNKVSDKRAYTFTLLWTLISVILLSVIPEKKSRYLLPVLIPLALNTGFYIEYLFHSFKILKNKWEIIPVYFNFGLIALIGLVFPIGGYVFLKDSLAGNWVWFIILSIALLGISILLIRNLFQKNIQAVFYLTIAFIASILSFGMPMAKSLTVNPEYNSLSNLRTWEAKTTYKVYEFSGISPELLWAYGKPIKVIIKNNKFEMPNDSQFGVLVSQEQQTHFKNKFKDFSIKKIIRYDMNPKGSDSRFHKPRLWRDLYLVTKP